MIPLNRGSGKPLGEAGIPRGAFTSTLRCGASVPALQYLRCSWRDFPTVLRRHRRERFFQALKSCVVLDRGMALDLTVSRVVGLSVGIVLNRAMQNIDGMRSRLFSLRVENWDIARLANFASCQLCHALVGGFPRFARIGSD